MPYLEKGGVYLLGRWVLRRVRVEVRARGRGKRRRVGRRSTLGIGLEPMEILPFSSRIGWSSNIGDMSVINIPGLDDICIHSRAYYPTLESNWVVSESVLAPEPEPELSPSIETRIRLSYLVGECGIPSTSIIIPQITLSRPHTQCMTLRNDCIELIAI
jgi:hypothetical protein